MSLVTRLKPATDHWNRPFRDACNEVGKCFVDEAENFMLPQFGPAA